MACAPSPPLDPPAGVPPASFAKGAAPKAEVSVLLADDHQIVRQGVRALLEATPLADGRCLRVVGEAGDCPAAVALCRQLRPAVAVLDVSLPGATGLSSGFDLAVALRRMAAAPAVVMLSMHVSPDHVRRAREAGAAAYVVKGSGVSVLAEAIGAASLGGSGPFPAAVGTPLTDREREVLAAIAQGSSNKAIAADLGISIHTVNSHRVNLMEKLDVHDVASLTRKALELGFA